MTWWWDCECIEYAFDPNYDVGGESEDLLFSRARRRTPGHVDEDGFVDRPGGRALRSALRLRVRVFGRPLYSYVPFPPAWRDRSGER